MSNTEKGATPPQATIPRRRSILVHGGWGSLKSLARIAGKETPVADAVRAVAAEQAGWCDVPPPAPWAKPGEPHAAEFCENGAKATLWELTSRRLHIRSFSPSTR